MMDPVSHSFKVCTDTEFKIDLQNSPLARQRVGTSLHWEVAGSKISPEIFLKIGEFLSLEDQVRATRVSKLFLRNFRALFPLVPRETLATIQKIFWEEVAYARFRGTYLLTISSVREMPNSFYQAIHGYILDKGGIEGLDYTKLRNEDCLWSGRSYSKQLRLLNTSQCGPVVSTATMENRCLVSIQIEGSTPLKKTGILDWSQNLFESNPEYIYMYAYSRNAIYAANAEDLCELKGGPSWSSRPGMDVVCIQPLSNDRLIFMGEFGKGSMWKCFPQHNLLENIQLLSCPKIRGAAVIERNDLEILVFPTEGPNCFLYDLKTGTKKFVLQSKSPVTCYHLLGKNHVWLGHENSVVSLWDLRNQDCLLTVKLPKVPLDFRYDRQESTLYMACEDGLLKVTMPDLAELDPQKIEVVLHKGANIEKSSAL